VLVLQDLWGINQDHTPRFVRRYLDGDCLLRQALDRYDADVKGQQFPGPEETYS
jgi:3-methyl-2-oxobutanoate hydroxymethyltransferase